MGHQTFVGLSYFKEDKPEGHQESPKYGQKDFHQRRHEDFEFLIFLQEHRKSYFDCSLEKFGPTLTWLPIFGDSKQSTLPLTKQTRRSWESLNYAYSGSKTSNKSTYL